jgi:hypothetical protein
VKSMCAHSSGAKLKARCSIVPAMGGLSVASIRKRTG